MSSVRLGEMRLLPIDRLVLGDLASASARSGDAKIEFPLQQKAREFGTSTRTVSRSLSRLEARGALLDVTPGRGWHNFTTITLDREVIRELLQSSGGESDG